MTYAAELIDATMTATGLSQAALAKALGVAPPQVSKWRHKTAPIPEEKLTAMFDLARMDEAAREYYTLGVVRDTVTTTGVMRALDGVLDRIRPALARVGIITVVLLAGYALPQQANAGPKAEPEHRSHCTLCAILEMERRLIAPLRPRIPSARPAGRSG